MHHLLTALNFRKHTELSGVFEAEIRTNTACSSMAECVPDDLREHVPEDLIWCNVSSGLCVCSDCFELFDDVCQLSQCRGFTSENNCTDHRKSQKKAVLLSAFLSSVGAANFYIEQYILGKKNMLTTGIHNYRINVVNW